MRALIFAGANVNAATSSGWTPLHDAAESGAVDCCNLLLSAGANHRIEDDTGSNALVAACSSTSCSTDVVQRLLEAGNDANSSDKPWGRTCLMFAAYRGATDICRILLDHNARLEALDSAGNSAIMVAILGGNPSAVRLFCERGATLTRLNKAGSSILHHISMHAAGIEVMQILKEQRMVGLPLSAEDVKEYWNLFRCAREKYFIGKKASLELEEAAFQALLDSVTPSIFPAQRSGPTVSKSLDLCRPMTIPLSTITSP